MGFESIEQHAQAVVEFVRANQIWAPFIVGALAFGESLAFVSLLLPATIALVGIGALVGASGIAFFPIWLGATVGAALGDWLSYWLGVKFEDPVAKVWPLSRYPDLLPSGHAFVERYGIYAVFIGRFFGPFRAVVPLVAGILEMPFWPFQFANVTSAMLWSAVLLTPGWFGLKFLS